MFRVSFLLVKAFWNQKQIKKISIFGEGAEKSYCGHGGDQCRGRGTGGLNAGHSQPEAVTHALQSSSVALV